ICKSIKMVAAERPLGALTSWSCRSGRTRRTRLTISASARRPRSFFAILKRFGRRFCRNANCVKRLNVEPVETPAGSIDSSHGDPRYKGDRHRADMAWAPLAAHHGLSQRLIEIEFSPLAICRNRLLTERIDPMDRMGGGTYRRQPSNSE